MARSGTMLDRPHADAIPRDYNFADDLLRRFRDCRLDGEAGLYRPARHLDLSPARMRAPTQFALVLESAGIQPGERVLMCLTDTIDWPTRVPRHALCRPCRGSGQHADDRGRLPLHARRQPGARMLVVSEELYPKFEKLIARASDLPPDRIGRRPRLPHQDLEQQLEA